MSRSQAEQKVNECIGTAQNEKFFDSSACKRVMDKATPLLNDISSDRNRELVKEFWSKIAHYLGIMFSLNAAHEANNIQDEPMGRIVSEKTNAILLEGKKLEDSLKDPETMKKVKQLFRENCMPLAGKSNFLRHAFTKPRGYAGDYGIIEMVYDNKVTSHGMGYCADKRFMDDDYAWAVRSRKTMMRDMLASYLKNFPGQSVKILNIACGSCRELKELFEQNTFDASKKIQFMLVDQDQEALDFSLKGLSHSPSNVEYQPLCHSVYEYLKEPEKYRKTFDSPDLIYTIGLADYIPEKRLQELLAFLFSIVKPGGRLVFAHKDSKNYSPLAPDWFCDWTFHLRDMDETINLVKTSGIRDYKLSVEREKNTNIIFFITLEKTA